MASPSGSATRVAATISPPTRKRRPLDTAYFDALIREHHLVRPALAVAHDGPGFSATTALILIDIQKAFDHPKWGSRNNPDAEANAAKLLAGWRASGRPVVHIRHLNPKPGSLFHVEAATSQIKDVVLPRADEPVFTKDVNSAFIGTPLEAWLRARGCEAVVLAGLTTPHCVSTTTRMAGNLGFQAHLVADATAAFALTGPDGHVHPAEEIHRVSLATLHDEFAGILDTADALARLDDTHSLVQVSGTGAAA